MKTHTHGSQTDVIDGFSEEEEGERSKDKGSCWVEAVGGHRERGMLSFWSIIEV